MVNKDNKSPKRELQKDFENEYGDSLDDLYLKISLDDPDRHRPFKPDNTNKIVCIVFIAYIVIWWLVTP
jgi:hypothetical protein